MHDLNRFQRDTLYIIASEGNPTGSGIEEELSEYYDKQVYDSRMYPALDELIEKGLVEKSKRDGRTNEYTLTKRGKRELIARQKWVAEATAPLSE